MSKLARSVASVLRLEDIPNIGQAVADKLRRIGITTPADLVGTDPYALYATLNAEMEVCHDPCLLDTFIAATRFMAGEPAKPWWAYTAERKACCSQYKDK